MQIGRDLTERREQEQLVQPALTRRGGELPVRDSGAHVVLRVEQRDVVADGLVNGVLLEPAGARVPRFETAQAIVHLGIELGSLRSRNSLKDALQLPR